MVVCIPYIGMGLWDFITSVIYEKPFTNCNLDVSSFLSHLVQNL